MKKNYKLHSPADAVDRVSRVSICGEKGFAIDPKCPVCGNVHVELLGTVKKDEGNHVVTNVICERGHQFAYVCEFKGGQTFFSVRTLESDD